MKIKTSITLSEELLEKVDHFALDFKNRSDFIEAALTNFIDQLIRNEQNARDLAIINQHADELNTEAQDALSYQVIP